MREETQPGFMVTHERASKKSVYYERYARQIAMSSVFRFDLLNYWLSEAVDINPCQCQAFPMVRRLILFPRGQEPQLDWQSGLSLAQQERSATAFLECDSTKDETALQKQAEEFMAWACWLLSLAELRDVYYWGSHHYGKESSGWKLKSSAWKQSTVADWKPTRLLGMNIFEGTVPYWRIPEFVSQGLKVLSDQNFPREDFIIALQIFLDSLRPNSSELTALRFIKKWIAFEELVNEHCDANGSMYVFGKPNSTDFLLLLRSLEERISNHPSVLMRPESATPLKRHLTQLQRFPMKILVRKFLDQFQIKYSEKDIDDLVDMRNNIMHYADETETSKSVYELDQILRGFLTVVLCKLLRWDFEELRVPYASPSGGQLPDYVTLEKETYALSAKGAGQIETDDGSCTVKCDGTVEWSPDSLLGHMTSTGQDGIKVHELHNKFKSVRLRLEIEDGTLLLDQAKIPHVEGLSSVLFNVVGLRVSRTT
jgi:hypothetical protein